MYSKEQLKDLCMLLEEEFERQTMPSLAIIPKICAEILQRTDYDYERFMHNCGASTSKFASTLSMDISQLPLYINSFRIEERLAAKWRLSKGI